jgi:hypothetical protein
MRGKILQSLSVRLSLSKPVLSLSKEGGTAKARAPRGTYLVRCTEGG